MLRIGAILKSGKVKGFDAKNLDEAIEKLLDIDYKSYKIIDKETKEVVDIYPKFNSVGTPST